MSRIRLVVFAKAPQAGFAKTRLIPALGAEGAARLAALMLRRTLREAIQAGCDEVELCATPALHDPAWANWQPPPGVTVRPQGDGDLGERLARAAERAFADGFYPLIIGTDCPGLGARRLREAADALTGSEVVIHGTRDGGYALIGLTVDEPELFRDIDWSTERVFAQTLQQARKARLHVLIKPTLQDIDEPADLADLPLDWQLELRRLPAC